MRHHGFHIRAALIVMMFGFMTVTSILAQSDTSSLSGTISDSSGAVVSNARVTVHNDATQTSRDANQYYLATRSPNLPHQFGSTGGAQWFEPDVFEPAPIGTFAPRGSRNVVYGPGFQSYNAALQKGFQIIPGHENHQLIFKAEAFNFANHPNWDNPDVNPTSSTFGEVTSKGTTYASERQLQFSLRYAF